MSRRDLSLLYSSLDEMSSFLDEIHKHYLCVGMLKNVWVSEFLCGVLDKTAVLW